MNKRNGMKYVILAGLILPVIAVFAFGSKGDSIEPKAEAIRMTEAQIVSGYKEAVFAGGCFWGVEAVFEELYGVNNVISGYSGGSAYDATYYEVGTGRTGHAESVYVVYDPEIISYETLLDVFFIVAHNPTELNFQGPDHGTEYRSAIFYINEEQKENAENYITALENRMVYSDEIVTELNQLDAFYAAEDYHQDFMVRNPNHPYILHWDLPKIEMLHRLYPDLIK